MRMEHAQLLSYEHFERKSKADIIASVQPTHAVSDRDLVDNYWGDRGARAYAFKSLLDAGVVLAFGSDSPVDTLDPIEGIRAAVFRSSTAEEQPWYPQECLNLKEALRAYTAGSAHAAGEEKIWGVIRPGNLADFTVLTEDILRDDGDENALWNCEVKATVVGGEVVYSNEEA